MDTNTTNIPETPQGQHPASLTRGVVIGLLVIVLTILVCALYLWGAMLSNTIDTKPAFVPPVNREPETPRVDADIEILNIVSSSDEISSIEADLESTNLDGLDKELDLIESELSQ